VGFFAAQDPGSPGGLADVMALARTLGRRDPYIHFHSQRVAFYAEALAQRLGLTDRRKNDIRIAGLIHDIGKVAVPEAILRKPGPLTAEEETVMRRHSEVGADIIAGAGLWEIALWVRHLHERIDGRGYPDGLAGDDIPIESRILAAADAFEAMSSPRVYRAATPVADVLIELERESGAQFDIRVVRPLANLVSGGRWTRRARPERALAHSHP
jgi:putative nucleotidyltransferase with HDIG domain